MTADERIEALKRELREAEEEEERQYAAGNWWEYHGAVMRQNRLTQALRQAVAEQQKAAES